MSYGGMGSQMAAKNMVPHHDHGRVILQVPWWDESELN